MTGKRFVILPPSWRAVKSDLFKNVQAHTGEYEKLLAEMQRLRGRVYLNDGAIQPRDLTPDGRHALKIDEHSWHVLTLDQYHRVSGCLRFLEERAGAAFDDLWIRNSALARCSVWGTRFRRAVEREIDKARLRRVLFGEVGGWAVAEHRRCTTDPLRMLLATCGLFRLLGGSIGLATATVRHGSAAILRRVGLEPLLIDGVELPAYYDPIYGCRMEALRYDSNFPNPKYAAAIDELSAEVALTPVVCRAPKLALWPSVVRTPEVPAPQFPQMPVVLPVAG